MKMSFEELAQCGINSFKCACGALKEQDPSRAELCLVAARTWANRAEFSLEHDCQLAESDFEQADRVIFERRLAAEHS